MVKAFGDYSIILNSDAQYYLFKIIGKYKIWNYWESRP